MPRVRTFRNAVSRSGKRQTDWFIGFVSAANTNVPANSKVLFGRVTAAALESIAPATVVRTRGVIRVASDQNAASELQLGALGLAFVSETAGALGVTAIEGPFSGSLWDGWFVHQFFMQGYQVTTAVGYSQGNAAEFFTVDSKAMRKFESDESLVFMVENSHATHGLDISVGLRILVKAG